ncbi:type VII secretion target [Nocardia wallacei]|uniref:type VII secretion target n=1 Tax=Nocardia wallacei TaxID=480035 RepID=UPI00245782C8|nr:type VII secretion target [Nocardia wallacei]
MVNIDAGKIRELAKDVRTNADTLAGKAPIAKASRDEARVKMLDSNFAVKVEESLQAMDTVLDYHVRRMRGFCDDLDKSAAAFEASEQNSAGELRQVEGPR